MRLNPLDIIAACAEAALARMSIVSAVVLLASAPVALAQCPTTQSCLVVHSPGGCDSQACCNSVCALDPACCITTWDSACVILANDSCIGYCGAAASGSCYTPHANPSCDTSACCAVVCGFDPFCCTGSWDLTCAQFAGFSCQGNPGTCGVTPASCFTAHAQGACSDAVCCSVVCQIDSTCCTQSWDAICVAIAEQTCVSGCSPNAEPGAVNEVELCDERLNDPCYATTGGTPQAITDGVQVRGTLGKPPSSLNGLDVDVFRFSVTDTDGDGGSKVTVTFASSPAAWVALVPDSACAPIASSVLHLSSQLCLEVVSPSVCLPAGSYRLIVSGGTYPAIGGQDINCINSNAYTVKVSINPLCVACSTAAPSCYSPHAVGGCNNPPCCTSVCASDPFCCDSEWDSGCVTAAAKTCLTGPPANDLCSGSIAMQVGAVTFNTARAGSEVGPPAGCSTIFRDVWYHWDANRSGTVEVQTCGTWFDTVLAVYTGDCAALTQLDCNDDGTNCVGIGGSKVAFVAECGVRYHFRVGNKSGQGGEATLRLLQLQSSVCINCPADLDRDGQVASSDITILLSAWGLPLHDLTGDGVVNSADLTVLLSAWGPCS